jgi:hypothetical protein
MERSMKEAHKKATIKKFNMPVLDEQ